MSDAPPEPAPPAPAAGPPDARIVATDVPQPRVVRAKRWNISMVWLLPAVAVAIALSMLLRTFLLVGPRIEIEFATAEGIDAGKTDVRYKDVVIGKVTSVSLRADRKSVIVGVQLDRAASSFAVEDTSFWVVRPRIGVAGVSGLGTLLSGAYIGADGGVSDKERSRFVGLEAPPFVLRGEPGFIFVLQAEDLGSLEVGSPVFHRRTRVGRVVGYTLDADRDELSVKIFVEAPYQKLVARETRFWNASGVDLSINASGLTLNTQTLASVLTGGLAFDLPPGVDKPTPAPADTVFTLYNDRRAALAPPDGVPVPVRMVFDQSIRGLAEGAAVELLGIEIGRVRSIALQYDGQRKRFPIEVVADIYPLRLGSVRTALLRDANSRDDAVVLQRLVGNGLRAQLRTGNLLTGQMYVALDFIPGTARIPAAASDGTLTMPTAPGTLSEIQPQIADIVQKVSKIPFDAIGRDLRTTLSRASHAIGQLTPEAQKSLAEVQRTLSSAQASLERLDRNVTDPNAPVQRNLEQTLLELQRTSRALRVLSEYLQRHPESLLRGKPADPPLPQR
ncbi:MAG TPA: MlaD family protein [Caldimonas sp.]|jgi:paraquat-inducible protein B|nr:MlaD family protein [Caldimonas sp.]HEX2542569.1 MlaD family protein [Caldimonas sp.]